MIAFQQVGVGEELFQCCPPDLGNFNGVKCEGRPRLKLAAPPEQAGAPRGFALMNSRHWSNLHAQFFSEFSNDSFRFFFTRNQGPPRKADFPWLANLSTAPYREEL